MTNQYTLDADEAPSVGVYSAVAATEDCSPLDLPPLAEMSDPDALDSILTSEGGSKEVTIHYAGYEVTAAANEIRLQESDSG